MLRFVTDMAVELITIGVTSGPDAPLHFGRDLRSPKLASRIDG